MTAQQSFISNVGKVLNLKLKTTKNAIKIYNGKRLHLFLDYKTPNMIFKIGA